VIGLDTNILVRYITQDEPRQAAMANRLIEGALSAESPGFVSTVVLVELAWVLESGYGCGRDQVASVFERLLRARPLIVESAEIVAHAVRSYAVGGADFADCLIERVGRGAGCDHTLTFDRIAARDAGMRLLEAGR
jgi:predicted nucleic-acid-binding protein